MNIINKVIRHFKQYYYIDRQNSLEEYRKVFMSFVTLLLIPIVVIFAIKNFVIANQVEAFVEMIFAFVLFLCNRYARKVKKPIYLWRIFIFIAVCLISFWVIDGGDMGAKLLWVYPFPIVTLFVLGRREAIIWNILLYTYLVVMLVWSPEWSYDYSISTIIRFLISYTIVILLCLIYESVRNIYQRKLRDTTNELQLALDNIKQLKGLLPICSSCKKIRDDKGYWKQLETYIQENSDAKFSHGLCDECSDKLYGNMEWYKKLKKKKDTST